MLLVPHKPVMTLCSGKPPALVEIAQSCILIPFRAGASSVAFLKPSCLLWESELGLWTGELLLYDDPNFGGPAPDVNTASACPPHTPSVFPSLCVGFAASLVVVSTSRRGL